MGAIILCADDDHQFCRIIQKALDRAGYRVVTAHDGLEAGELAREEAPEFAILSVELPGLDGLGVLERIRQLAAPVCDIPALLLSDCDVSDGYRQEARRLGAMGVVSKPITLEKLQGLIKRFIKPEPPRFAGASASKEPPLAGTLAELSFPHLLHHLHGLRASGVLVLAGRKKRKAVQIRDGYPVAVKSNLVSECLGGYLVRRGVVSEDEMNESLARMRKGEGLQGEILVAMEVADEEVIARALRGHAEEKLFEIFEWSDGRFRFQIGAELDGGNSLALDQSPANVIIAGVRSRLPLETVVGFFADNADRFVGRGESPFYQLQEIDLTGSEQAILEGLSGAQPLREFDTAAEGVRRLLYGLIVTEILQLSGERKATAQGQTHRPVPVRPAPAAARERAPGSAPDQPIELRAAKKVRGAAPPLAAPDEQRGELVARAKQMRSQSYFEMLDLAETAGNDEIERAYARIARDFHPDRFADASGAIRALADEVFQMLSKARSTLLDTKLRLEYQSERRRGQKRKQQERRGVRTADAETEFQLGESKLRSRAYEDALVHFGKAIELNPKEGEHHAHYGWCLHLCHPDDPHMVEEAIEHVRRGVKLARDREKPYLFLGRLYKVIGKNETAEKMFTRAVSIRPGCVEAMRELRLINLRREKNRGLIGKIFRK